MLVIATEQRVPFALLFFVLLLGFLFACQRITACRRVRRLCIDAQEALIQGDDLSPLTTRPFDSELVLTVLGWESDQQMTDSYSAETHFRVRQKAISLFELPTAR